MDDGASIVHQGWLELSSFSSKKGSKNWLNRAVSKSWKRFFFILHKSSSDDERVIFSGFDKEENLRYTVPRKELLLSPKYKVSKKSDFKSREFVMEISNDSETWFLAADNQKSLDLWVVQVQMQTRLSRAISGRIFSVVGTSTKSLQRIGGRDQQCLLHFTKWGIALALQQTRSILALWPLSTIRNYECTGTGQFCFESGRRSPMGTGKYVFFTGKGEDEVMFNVIDVFVNARLNANAEMGKEMPRKESTDEELLATYDKLHSCALGLLSQEPQQATGGNALAVATDSPHSEPQFVQMDRPPSYSRLDHHVLRPEEVDSSSPMPLPTPDFSTIMGAESSGWLDRSASFNSPTQDGTTAYDQLDRTQSWGSKSQASMYDRIERSANRPMDSYDHINRVQTHSSSFTLVENEQQFLQSDGSASMRKPASSVNRYEDHPKASSNAALIESDEHSAAGNYYPNALYSKRSECLPGADGGIMASTAGGHTKAPRWALQPTDQAITHASQQHGDVIENSPCAGGDTHVHELAVNSFITNENLDLSTPEEVASDDVIGLIDNMIAETRPP